MLCGCRECEGFGCSAEPEGFAEFERESEVVQCKVWGVPVMKSPSVLLEVMVCGCLAHGCFRAHFCLDSESSH